MALFTFRMGKQMDKRMEAELLADVRTYVEDFYSQKKKTICGLPSDGSAGQESKFFVGVSQKEK